MFKMEGVPKRTDTNAIGRSKGGGKGAGGGDYPTRDDTSSKSASIRKKRKTLSRGRVSFLGEIGLSGHRWAEASGKPLDPHTYRGGLKEKK